MKRRRHTPEQIIRKLREAERLLAEGQEVPEVAKALRRTVVALCCATDGSGASTLTYRKAEG